MSAKCPAGSCVGSGIHSGTIAKVSPCKSGKDWLRDATRLFDLPSKPSREDNSIFRGAVEGNVDNLFERQAGHSWELRS